MKKNIIVSILLCACGLLAAQEKMPVDSFLFTVKKEIPITSVKNQASSGTCWSYSAIGFLEAELLRKGKGEQDFSEMFVVHHSYSDKADKYVRMHGTINFAAGGSLYDVLYVWKHYGAVPQELMQGLNYGEEKNKHGEMDEILKSYVEAVVRNKNKKLSSAWKRGFDAVLNEYLGTCPKTFTVKGKEYTPKSYAESFDLNMEEYVSLTSFTHHPFYSSFPLEIPDNWRWSSSYNLPIEELSRVFDYAVDNGFTIAWASDVSEKGFTRKGIAVNPETKKENLPGSDQARWLNISEKEMQEKIYLIEGPQPEVKVTQELRQEGFDNYQTTDDHGMLIYGKAEDQNGNKYYLVKNSWGTDTKYKGIWYASESFVLHKTMSIVVHKDALPKDIKKKLGIK